MPGGLTIGADWERSSEGEPEERATFGMFTVRAEEVLLTEGYDHFVRRLRDGPLVAACHVAEWFAWNWWRLRWEPRTRREDWPFAHRMASIGHGYLWPNITIQSDGERVVIIAQPSSHVLTEPFRFVADRIVVVAASRYEAAVDEFVALVLDRLVEEAVGETNLHRLWADVRAERNDPELARSRRLEALIGAEPDEGDQAILAGLLADIADVGEAAVGELAADQGAQGGRHSVAELREQARQIGVSATPGNAVALREVGALPAIGSVPAWRRGAEAARLLRRQEGLDGEPISNRRLTEMAAVPDTAINPGGKAALSFVLDDPGDARVVLRSKWETGRRFELSRLIGDRISMPAGDRLRPATRAHTYRQKMQRAFAAEFLCPFEALEEKLGGDYSDEAIEDAAGYYDVSDRAVRTLLVNHGRLERDAIEAEDEPLVAA